MLEQKICISFLLKLLGKYKKYKLSIRTITVFCSHLCKLERIWKPWSNNVIIIYTCYLLTNCKSYKDTHNIFQLQTIFFWYWNTCIVDGTVSCVMQCMYYLCSKDTNPLKYQYIQPFHVWNIFCAFIEANSSMISSKSAFSVSTLSILN